MLTSCLPRNAAAPSAEAVQGHGCHSWFCFWAETELLQFSETLDYLQIARQQRAHCNHCRYGGSGAARGSTTQSVHRDISDVPVQGKRTACHPDKSEPRKRVGKRKRSGKQRWPSWGDSAQVAEAMYGAPEEQDLTPPGVRRSLGVSLQCKGQYEITFHVLQVQSISTWKDSHLSHLPKP